MLILGFIIVQTIIFTVVFFVLRRLMIQNTTSAVNRLKLVDEDNQKRLEEMKLKIEQSELEYKQKIAEQAQELHRQREDAKKQMAEEKSKVLNEARVESEKILSAAKSRSGKMDQELEKDVQERAATLSAEVVRRLLSQGMTAAFNDQLVHQFLSEVEKLEAVPVPHEVREAEVILPCALNSNGKKKIQEILEKKLGRPIELKETVKKDMMGGMILNLGSLVMDGSLENKLDGIFRDFKKQK